MAHPKEYLKELLKKAIPDASGETVNFRELRNLLEASIENQTRKKSSTSKHHAKESQIDPNKSVVSTESGASSLNNESKIESGEETDEKKHDVSPAGRKTFEKTEEKCSSSDEEKSTNRPNAQAKDTKSKRDSERSSRYSTTDTSKAKSSGDKLSEAETTSSDVEKAPSATPKSPEESPPSEKGEQDSKFADVKQIFSEIIEKTLTRIQTETNTASSTDEEKETHGSDQNEESNSSGTSGTAIEQKPPMDGDRRRYRCDDGELLLVVRMPKDLVCSTNDQTEFKFELKDEDLKKR